jgi:hypothetical protein
LKSQHLGCESSVLTTRLWLITFQKTITDQVNCPC